MALTGVTSQGFEHVRNTSDEEIMYLPGDPGDTFTRGDAVYMNNGVLDRATADSAIVGTVVTTTVCPAATTGFPKPGLYNPNVRADVDKSLVPVKMMVPGGVPVWKVSFSGHADDALAAYTAGTPSVTLTTSTGANDDINSALIYVYDGPGKGQLNYVADYVHATKIATLHRIFTVAPTTASSVIILEGEGSAGDGISMLGRVDPADHNNIDPADGQDDGLYVVYMDHLTAPALLQKEQMLVIHHSALGL